MTVRAPTRRKRQPTPKAIRVAIYTRKSVSEGLDQEFNTLDAQREAVEAYVASQRSEGWVALEDRYDDGGFTGANTARPAFQQLLADIEAGEVDVVAVYKIDRFSRSLLDFMKIMEFLEKHDVGFTSVTQAFDTRTSTGRMILRLLMTFAEFERETISERTRDKVVAARRKGMWTGGRPVLGYDVVEKKLIVNETEADQVREIFRLYLKHGSLLAVVDELKARGWRGKTWTNKAGKVVEGGVFNKVTLSHMLRNPLYVGKVRAAGELCDGLHEAIIGEETWEDVQAQLKSNAEKAQKHGRKNGRPRGSALLSGIIRCGVCGSAMSPHHTKKGDRRYSYYICQRMQKEGAKACPGSRVSAGQLERFVLDQVREVGRDPALLEATIAADRVDRKSRRPELVAETRKLAAEAGRLKGERENLVNAIARGNGDAPALVKRVAELDEQVATVESRAGVVSAEIAALDAGDLDVDGLRRALEDLEFIWDALFPAERSRLLDLLLERVEFHGSAGEVAITFRPGGPQAVQAGGEQ